MVLSGEAAHVGGGVGVAGTDGRSVHLGIVNGSVIGAHQAADGGGAGQVAVGLHGIAGGGAVADRSGVIARQGAHVEPGRQSR